ncbi:CBO0543 family protein [Gracilibacillus sp. YIM 98692]|uniref:CBO0543 family protein n=1 Tax=Gracilibacillus sp. YIM 98692 TaxID=2663532 RepID=UPI0013CF7369|nr:CBO0543 family protein [Gracilibacillus sp. YIM 98692]
MYLLFISVLVFGLVVYFMPKKITYFEMYTTSLFSTVLQLIIDVYLEFKYDLYGYFSPGVDYITLWVVFWIFPTVNIIFLNFYPKSRTLLCKVFYILGWSAFAITYEWFAVYHSDFFYYNDWKLLYSVPIYPILYILILLNWKIIKTLHLKALK